MDLYDPPLEYQDRLDPWQRDFAFEKLALLTNRRHILGADILERDHHPLRNVKRKSKN